MQLSFFGATQTVTGSRYLVTCGERRVLVDCGLFQGYKHLRLKNWSPLPFDLRELDAVLLTHAHLDHSGYLQEEQAQFANRHRFSKHSPALPLYTEKDAERCLKQFEPVRFNEPFASAPGVRAELSRAGHLLGAASIRVVHEDTSILFSGDLGRPDDPLMHAPAAPVAAD